MGQIGKTCFFADTGNAVIRFQKHTLGVKHPCHVEVLNDGFSGDFLKFPAQVVGADIEHVSQGRDRNFFGIMLVNVIDRLCRSCSGCAFHRGVIGPENGQQKLI